MAKEIIRSEHAPAAIGPYSQAVRVGDTIWLSGQIPLDPRTMELVGGDFETQAVRVFENLDAVVRAAGCALADIVKLNIYLDDIGNFPVVNEVMSRYFNEPYPARAAMQVAALPKGAAIEADCVLYLQRGS